jgi:hypothetical protein
MKVISTWNVPIKVCATVVVGNANASMVTAVLIVDLPIAQMIAVVAEGV